MRIDKIALTAQLFFLLVSFQAISEEKQVLKDLRTVPIFKGLVADETLIEKDFELILEHINLKSLTLSTDELLGKYSDNDVLKGFRGDLINQNIHVNSIWKVKRSGKELFVLLLESKGIWHVYVEKEPLIRSHHVSIVEISPIDPNTGYE